MVPFAIRTLDHVVLRCVDLDRMLAFYCDILGCTIAKRNEALGLIHLRAGTTLIDLVPLSGELGRASGPPPGPGPNMDHLCLRIEPFDADALLDYLRQSGLEPGEVKKRFGAEGDGPSVYIADPEGNRVELKGPATQ